MSTYLLAVCSGFYSLLIVEQIDVKYLQKLLFLIS